MSTSAWQERGIDGFESRFPSRGATPRGAATAGRRLTRGAENTNRRKSKQTALSLVRVAGDRRRLRFDLKLLDSPSEGPRKRDIKIDQWIEVVDNNADLKKQILFKIRVVQIKIKGENEDDNLDLI
ncbi:hypothetical protein QVD17_17953 [Tagetes erecta]|uniref:Uncharacterized protein n=1 Tax=Tagetes erecta TaxID=13708 RepID=A0AAD8KLS6_TARER|nr:hypothetical protein QVD17_17953 [Tagetes erecta]